MKQNLKERRA